jgi:hypothetical protein
MPGSTPIRQLSIREEEISIRLNGNSPITFERCPKEIANSALEKEKPSK